MSIKKISPKNTQRPKNAEQTPPIDVASGAPDNTIPVAERTQQAGPDHYEVSTTAEVHSALEISTQLQGRIQHPVFPDVLQLRTQSQIDYVDAPAADHPFMQYRAAVHDALSAEGLPTSAEGVRVHVLDITPDHGGAVGRTITGPAGIAPGADVIVDFEVDMRSQYGAFALTDAELARTDRAEAALMFESYTSVEKLIEDGVAFVEQGSHQKRLDIARALSQIPEDYDQVSILNLSYDHSPRVFSKSLAKRAFTSPIFADLRAEVARELDIELPQVTQFSIDEFIAKKIRLQLTHTPTYVESLEKLDSEAKSARERGLLVFEAAGNNGKHMTIPVAHIIRVGAVDINEPLIDDDDRVASFSGAVAMVAAPGVGIPVGRHDTLSAGRTPRNVNGTSFASPYASGVAALMVKANPDITADQIADIIFDPANATDIVERDYVDQDEYRDGNGLIDVVAVVRAAKNLVRD